MALSYYFTITASAEASSSELEGFLRKVEKSAKELGFAPTMVLNAKFDTNERRQFARRLTSGYPMEDPCLAGLVIPKDGQLWNHDLENGACRLIPVKAVVLLITDQSGSEVCLGFFKYPDLISDIHGKVILASGLNGKWIQRDFIDTPDPRFRTLLQIFAASGFLESEKDEYV
jgi:hypothetical protein